MTGTLTRQGSMLLGAVQRNFSLLAELDKDAPGDVQAILGAMVAHMRSWKPHVLLQSQLEEAPDARR